MLRKNILPGLLKLALTNFPCKTKLRTGRVCAKSHPGAIRFGIRMRSGGSSSGVCTRSSSALLRRRFSLVRETHGQQSRTAP
jgi:hypothetical protein